MAHNRAIDHQLQQLYHALGLALALNRTLLMPAMACLCVRGWFPNEACRLPGDSRSSLPFRCTGDQVGRVGGGWEVVGSTGRGLLQMLLAS